ncbi:hypothetical protein SAMN05444161_4694 [Rhizobiales bacterium GAS191]|nr:hypothetical protein SAMN05444161_4694 [Rhizobiales bacterium GAS191]
MARVTQFGVIPVFRGLEGRLAVQKEMRFSSEDEARRAGKIFAEVLGGAVAFRRVSDPETGAAEAGEIIGRYGILADAPIAPKVKGAIGFETSSAA